MKFRPLVAVAVAAVMMFAVSSCGGKDDTNSGSRPSASEITAAFKEEVGGAMPDDLANCVGEGLHESDLPNGVLRALVEGREAEVDKDNVDKYESTVEEVAVDCATASLGDLDLGDIDLEDLEGFED